jgi:hypothetical protein
MWHPYMTGSLFPEYMFLVILRSTRIQLLINLLSARVRGAILNAKKMAQSLPASS